MCCESGRDILEVLPPSCSTPRCSHTWPPLPPALFTVQHQRGSSRDTERARHTALVLEPEVNTNPGHGVKLRKPAILSTGLGAPPDPQFNTLVPSALWAGWGRGSRDMGGEGALGTAPWQVQGLQRPSSDCYANGDLQGSSC